MSFVTVRLIFCICSIGLFSGCAGIDPPGPDRILAPWAGTPAVRIGESKDSVRDKWGEPDEINGLGTDSVGLVKEEWVYFGRYPSIPVDRMYLSKTKRLMFTGNSVTGYEPKE